MKRIQSGFTSLLFILLVGMALTVATIGYVASIKTMQSSAVTTHAQTQAQMQTMVGYQVLSEFLKDSNVKVDTISTGTVNSTGQVINYQKPTSGCPTGTGHYCFDIIGESGGAKAILRALFKVTDSIGSSSATGSIFAGGLNVFGHAGLSGIVGVNGEKPSIAVGANTKAGTAAGVITGGGTVTNITVNPYLGDTTFPDAAKLLPYANYIFTLDDKGKVVCHQNNLYSSTSTPKDITTKVTMTPCPPSGVSRGKYKGNDVWEFDSHLANLPGIIWFDGDVLLKLHQTPNDYINSVIATGTVETDQVDGKKTYKAYAPYHYLLEADNSNIKNRLLKVCPADKYPTQYCKPYSQAERDKITDTAYFDNHKSDFLKDMEAYPANLANILLLTDTGFALTSNPDSPMFLYGNLIGTRGAGGTGAASGKFNGNADINIFGNIMLTGDTLTEMGGSTKLKLGKAKGGGNTIPTIVKSVTPSSISYQ